MTPECSDATGTSRTDALNHRLENDVLRVELDSDYPAIRSTIHKSTGVVVNGLAGDQLPSLVVNGTDYLPGEYRSECCSPGVYAVDVPDVGIRLTLSFRLEGGDIVFRLEEVSEESDVRLQTVYFRGHSLASAGPDWRYFRWRHVQKPWDVAMGKGLWRGCEDSGMVGAAVPDLGRQPLTFACLWTDRLCVTARASFIVKPIELHLLERSIPDRTSHAALQAGVYHYRAGSKLLEPMELRIGFVEDLNRDGKADYNDAALWYRRQHPEPDPLYRDNFIYKVYSAEPPDSVFVTFKQCLDIIRTIYLLSDGMPQIVYVVGWQYDGHDSGYPSLDVVNERLGGREKLLWLIEEGRKLNAIVSCHINLDDAYYVHPGWDPEIIGRNPDGSLAEWEVFNGLQSYHINHTRDVTSGKLFDRLDKFLSLVPVEKTIHIDAFRFTNESWEGDKHTSLVEELELGMKPILEYFRKRGIDPTCESVDYGPADLTGVFSFALHASMPLMQFGKLLTTDKRDTLLANISGVSVNYDITSETSWDWLADIIYLGVRLYQLFLTTEMTAYWSDGRDELHIQFGDVGLVTATAGTLTVEWEGIHVARDYHRFVPVGDGLIYAYSKTGGDQSWILPAGWEGRSIEAHTITPDGLIAGPELHLRGREITFRSRPHCPVRLRLLEC
jgi:hypothetical protein